MIWCAIGAAVGLVAFKLSNNGSSGALVEDLLVGIFGAFVGGEFLARMIMGEAALSDGYLHFSNVMAGVGGALAALVVLAILRAQMGPVAPQKKRRRAH